MLKKMLRQKNCGYIPVDEDSQAYDINRIAAFHIDGTI
jgi:hypothetical protein